MKVTWPMTISPSSFFFNLITYLTEEQCSIDVAIAVLDFDLRISLCLVVLKRLLNGFVRKRFKIVQTVRKDDRVLHGTNSSLGATRKQLISKTRQTCLVLMPSKSVIVSSISTL